jgi:hypothetical protein
MGDDVARVLGREASEKACSGAYRVEASDVRQALAHGLDPNGDKRLGVIGFCTGQRDERFDG